MNHWGLVLGLCLVAAHAQAGTEGSTMDAQLILQDQQQLQREISEGTGRAAGLTSRQKNEVRLKQEALFTLLDGRSSVLELSEDKQVRAHNLVEEIKAIVTKAGDEKMVCRRERATGSNRTTTVCRSQKEMQEARDSAQKWLGPNSRMLQDSLGN